MRSPVLRLALALALALASAAAAAAAPPPPPSAPLPMDASIFDARPPDPRALDASAFGAVGDGVTDDTAALQRALDAAYAPGAPDCTRPGARQVFLQGGGRRYLLSASLRLWTWVRLVGWGATRPQLLLAPATPGFANASALAPLLRVIDGTPAGTRPCTANAADGGNTAFGVGVLNVDVAIGGGNPGAVGLRWRAAQGGVLRAMRFDLAPDTPAAVHSPGWAHEDLHVLGGRAAVLFHATGAWPSVFRDCVFEGQAGAGFAWDAPPGGDPAAASAWEGATAVRCAFSRAPAAVNATGVLSARVTLLGCSFSDLAALALPPALAAGASSLLVRASGGARVPVLLGASDAGPALPSPGGARGAFAIAQLAAGAQSSDARSGGGAAPRVALTCDAAPAPAPPPPPPRDTFAFPPSSTWTSVAAHGVVGDGATDCAPALRALLRAAPPGAALFFPAGVYVLGSAVALRSRVTLLGLSPWDVVLTLPDGAAGYADPGALAPILEVGAGAGGSWVVGMNIRSGFSFGAPAPPPAPAGARNPNPGALALLWLAPSGGVQDAFFHPATFPDNPRVLPSPQTELSLVVRGSAAGGVFADLWSCNAYSLGGARVEGAQGAVVFYQLSSEHHAGGELLLANASAVAVHCMQTEDRSPDAAPTAALVLQGSARVDATGLFAYYAANVSSAAAVVVGAGAGGSSVGAFRQWHSYHPMFYNCSVLVEGGGGGAGGGGSACVAATDFAYVGVPSG